MNVEGVFAYNIQPLVTMEPKEICAPSAFDTLFLRSVPHILEKIFFSLDYKSFKTCMSVNKTWRDLHATARYKKELAKMLIEKNNNEKKLYSASRDGNAEEVRRLIYTHMVNVNFEMGQSQSTPLIEASKRGHNKVIRILLDSGADIEKADKWGYTPLNCAADFNCYESVNLLLKSGADVDKENICGRTPLWWGQSIEIAKMLIEHGADPNKADEYGRTPLHRAFGIGSGALIKTLIEGGADPDRKDKWGMSPLEKARNEPKNKDTVDMILKELGWEDLN